MMSIEIARTAIYVNTPYPHPTLDDLAARLGGTWHGKGKPAGRYYEFPLTAEEEVRLAVGPTVTPVAPEEPQPAAPATMARPARRSHPLGRAVRRETGCTVYEDELSGGGTVRIYDES